MMDNNVASKERYPYKNITVVTLIIDEEDIYIYIFPDSKYAAEHIPDVKLISFKKVVIY